MTTLIARLQDTCQSCKRNKWVAEYKGKRLCRDCVERRHYLERDKDIVGSPWRRNK